MYLEWYALLCIRSPERRDISQLNSENDMNDINITTYRGFSTVSGTTTLTAVIEGIRQGAYAHLIRRIEDQLRLGNVAKAEEIKRQLPFFTLTAHYAECRRSHSITGYEHVLTIDVDKLTDEQLEPMRRLLEADPCVLACFLSPKRHGYKIFLYPDSAYARRLRETTFSVPALSYAELEKYHARIYEVGRAHIETLLGVPVDTSGKDPGRGFFTSFDPLAYLNIDLLGMIPEQGCLVVADEEKEKVVGGRVVGGRVVGDRVMGGKGVMEDKGGGEFAVEPWVEIEYKKALSTTRRSEKFCPGNRNVFLFTLGNRCYRKGLDESTVCRLAERDFGGTDLDVSGAVHNAYTYVSKTDAAEKAKEEKVPVIRRVMDFLDERYDVRRNVVLDRLEFRVTAGDGAGGAGDAPLAGYMPLRTKDLNSIYVDLQMADINCTQNNLKSIIDSGYPHDFHPFEDYLFGLPAWDGVTDYIGLLADTIKTEDRAFWRDSFRRWLVGAVACVLDDTKVNQLVLILFGGQGKGKSTWIRRLLPPQWKEYYYNGMLNPDNKDDMLQLPTRFLINMEEFEGVKPGELAGLKRLVTQDSVILRKVYDTQAVAFPRRASLIASTNNRQCLQDISGNRRFLPSSVLEVDYSAAVNYTGIYSQALSLLRTGFRYWYEGEEIDSLNEHNEHHRMKDPVEENLFVYFRKALPEDTQVKWMPAAAILAKLSIFGKIQVNRYAQQSLVAALEKYEFKTRVNDQGTTEYEVVVFQGDEVERRFEE